MRYDAWTPTELRYLARNYGKQDLVEIASMLGRTADAVRTTAHRQGLTKPRFHTAAEIAYVRAHAGEPIASVAQALGRSYSSTSQLKVKLGLAQRKRDFTLQDQDFLRAKNAAGWSDTQIAASLGCERHTIRRWRTKLNLPQVLYSAHQRHRVSLKTRAQCAAAGVKSLAEVRRLAFMRYAFQAGLPEDLLPREVQTFQYLLRAGPSTRRAICEGIGCRWKGSRQSMHANRPEGSHLAHLMKRGLVVSLGRVSKGQGRGHSVNLYTVPLAVAEQVTTTRMQRSAHVQNHAA